MRPTGLRFPEGFETFGQAMRRGQEARAERGGRPFAGAKGDTLVSNFTPFERIHPIGIGTGQHGPEPVETGTFDELVHAAVVLAAVGVNGLRGQEITFPA